MIKEAPSQMRAKRIWDARRGRSGRASRRGSIELLKQFKVEGFTDERYAEWLDECPKLTWDNLPDDLKNILAVRL